METGLDPSIMFPELKNVKIRIAAKFRSGLGWVN